MSQVSVRERRPPREFWLHEARDFTPWMAENLSFLSESLNMELAFEAREKRDRLGRSGVSQRCG